MEVSSKHIKTGLVVLVAILAVALKYWDYIVNPWTRDGQVRAKVIQITPRVSGPLVNLSVVDNQLVNAGDLLFEIDPRTFKANLDQASAQYDKARDDYVAKEKQVDAARAQVEVAKGEIVQAQSQISELEAQIAKDRAEFERQQELVPQRASSQKSLDRASANYQVSLAQHKAAAAGVIQANASLLQAEASLAKAQANLGAPGEENASLRAAQAALEQAQLNLGFTQLRAPVDGYVTNLNLRHGSQAVTNQPALALVDINSYWVDGFFKETDIGDMKPGNKALVTLMSYPGSPIEGYVDSLGWGIAQQDGSTGTDLLPNVSPTFEWIRLAQRVPVRVHLSTVPEEISLRVGTTASVVVMTGKMVTGDARKKAE